MTSEPQLEVQLKSNVRSMAGTNRLAGVDSIRFVCALIVMLGHLGLTVTRPLGGTEHGITRLAIGIYNSLFNGPAAVIVFFVISGFCIHLPFQGGKAMVLSVFFTRRFLRIFPPALASVLISRLVLHDHAAMQATVLWSVVCEGVYYLLYPSFLYLRRRSNWLILTMIAYAFAGILISSQWKALTANGNAYTSLGSLTWIIGLPCWLFGCWLAENYKSFAMLPTAQLWTIRAAIFGVSVTLRLIKFHVPAPLGSNCILLDLFAPLACYWVGVELANAAAIGSPQLLERAGRWSYSLYLVHPLTVPLLVLIGLSSIASSVHLHILVIATALLCSYAFHLVVEAPCHRLAMATGRLWSRKEGERMVAVVQ